MPALRKLARGHGQKLVHNHGLLEGEETCWRALAGWSWSLRATEMTSTKPPTYHSTVYVPKNSTLNYERKSPYFAMALQCPFSALY